MTSELCALDLKIFLPAKDFERSKQFHADLGFTVTDVSPELAFCVCGASKFLLERFYVRKFAQNLLMHLLVDDVEAWWSRATERQLAARYGVEVLPPEERPEGIRSFVIYDPSGILWRIEEYCPSGIWS